jgi:hypothetical protein
MPKKKANLHIVNFHDLATPPANLNLANHMSARPTVADQ